MVDYSLAFGFFFMVIGMVVSLAMDKILHYIDLVLSYQENGESLKAKVENLETILGRLGELELNIFRGTSSTNLLAVKEWFEELKTLHGAASEMVQNCIIPRVFIISRYKTSKKITKTISDIDKHLKLLPVIQLELLLCQLMHIPRVVPKMGVELMLVKSVLHGGRGLVMKRILRHFKIFFSFNTELESLQDLVRSIRPIFSEIWQIQRKRISAYTEEEAINVIWLPKMRQLLEGADKIECVPWWKVIYRHKKAKEITSLISDIDAHVKLASVITLEPIFQLTEDVKSLLEQNSSLLDDLLSRIRDPQQTEPQAEEVEDEENSEVVVEVESSQEEEDDPGESAALLGEQVFS